MASDELYRFDEHADIHNTHNLYGSDYYGNSYYDENSKFWLDYTTRFLGGGSPAAPPLSTATPIPSPPPHFTGHSSSITDTVSTTIASPWDLFTTTTTTTILNSTTSNTSETTTDSATAADFPPPYSLPIFILICIGLGSFSLTTLVGNMFVVMSILTEKSLQTVANYLILSLAIADMLVATTVMPLAVMLEAKKGQWLLGALPCDLWTMADVLW